MKDRIRYLRKEILHLTQQEFADRIGIKRNTITNYEVGRNDPVDSVISLICREFNVNESWLREGSGDVFVERTHSQIVVDFLGSLVKEPDSFKTSLIEALAQLDPSQWIALEKWIQDLVAIEQSKKAE